MFSRLYKDINLSHRHQLSLLATNLEQRLKQNSELGTVIWELDKIVTALNKVIITSPPTTHQLFAHHTDRVINGNLVYYIDDKSNLKKSDSLNADITLFTLSHDRFSY
jgi:folate-dependent tRNA-U54 methylase TrmFO/GidA